jgi:hypothetical protein
MAHQKETFETLSTIEAAQKYNVSPNYITQLARKGLIKARKLARDWAIDNESLQAYLNNPRKRGPKPQSQKPRKAVADLSDSLAVNSNGTRKSARKKEQSVPLM